MAGGTPVQNILPQPIVPQPANYWPGLDTVDQSSPPAYLRTKKTKKDLLAQFRKRTSTSKAWRENTYDKNWTRLIDLYRGKQFSALGDRDNIAVNICFSTINVIAPSVAVNYPKIQVGARDETNQDAAEIVTAAVNYWWRRYKWRDDIKKAVKDSLIIGGGWVKLGWKYGEKDRPLTSEERAAHTSSLQEQANQAAMADPAIAADLPTDTDIEDMVPDSVKDVSVDRPFVERVSPFDIFIDPEATCDNDLKWIAQRIVAPLERVQSDPRYNVTARNKLRPDASMSPRWRDKNGITVKSPRANGSGDDRTDDIKRVTLWEFWDIEHEFYCVYAEAGDGFLVDPTDNPFPFPHPFVFLPNYEVPDQFYSVGDLEMIEPMQHELNAVRSDMANHRKRWQRAYLINVDKLDSEAMAALASDKDGRLVPVHGDVQLGDIVLPIPQTPLDAQMYNYSQTIEQDVELISGITEYQRGSAPEIRRTATEANLIQSGTDARVSDKLAQVEHFIAEVAERVVQLAQQYLTGEEVVRTLGPMGGQQWKTFTREEIQGEYDFMVEAGSTQPRDETYYRNLSLQMLQTLSPFFNTLIDAPNLIAHVLKEGFLVNDVQNFFVKQPYFRPIEQLREMMAYKDLPADVQRQMEEQAGFQPSQIGGTSPMELAGVKTQDPTSPQQQQQEQSAQGQQQIQEQVLQNAQHMHEQQMQHADQQHELTMNEQEAYQQQLQQASGQQQQNGQQ